MEIQRIVTEKFKDLWSLISDCFFSWLRHFIIPIAWVKTLGVIIFSSLLHTTHHPINKFYLFYLWKISWFLPLLSVLVKTTVISWPNYFWSQIVDFLAFALYPVPPTFNIVISVNLLKQDRSGWRSQQLRHIRWARQPPSVLRDSVSSCRKREWQVLSHSGSGCEDSISIRRCLVVCQEHWGCSTNVCTLIF